MSVAVLLDSRELIDDISIAVSRCPGPGRLDLLAAASTLAHGMKTRRDFLKQLTTGSLVVGLAGETQAGRRITSESPFTKAVRQQTRALTIEKGRWEWIVCHHSAIKEGNASIYDRVHRERGMENGLAYHFVIGNGIDSRDGEIEIGSRWLKQLQGGHVHREDINQVGIGICLVGNFETAKPTLRQLTALRELVDYLRADVVGRKVRFAVHREIEPGRTVCPGRYFPVADLHRRYGRFAVPRSHYS